MATSSSAKVTPLGAAMREAVRSDAKKYAPPRLSDREARLRRALARPREPWRFELGGCEISVGHCADAQVASGLRIKARCDDGPLTIDAAESVVELTLAELGASLELGALDAELGAILVEAALERPLAAAETALGRTVRFEGVERLGSNSEGPSIGFRLRAAGEPEVEKPFTTGDVIVTAPMPFLELVARAWSNQPAEPASETMAAPMAVALRFGGTRIGAHELAKLEVGDILVLEAAANQIAAPIAVIGEKMIALVQIEKSSAKVASKFVRASSMREGMVLMSDTDETPPLNIGPDGPIEIDGVEDAPVKLVFELGRSQCTVADLSTLGPGYVFPLAKPVGEEVDIYTGGVKIGDGQIVRLNEAIGVRILRLAGKREG